MSKLPLLYLISNSVSSNVLIFLVVPSLIYSVVLMLKSYKLQMLFVSSNLNVNSLFSLSIFFVSNFFYYSFFILFLYIFLCSSWSQLTFF